MSRYQARLVRLEGVHGPCVILLPHHFLHHEHLPDELVVDFDKLPRHPEIEKKGAVKYRLMPSTAEEREPVYREVFDE